MTPNLFVLGKTVFSPNKWFVEKKKSSGSDANDSGIQHWEYPVPGYYEHETGRGWYLIAKDGASQGSIKVPPTKVTYSKVLKRWIFASDMEDRKCRGRFLDENLSQEVVGFFRLDDGVSWVNSSDATGNFLTGPYTLYCIDAESKRFRVMRKRDDPMHQQRKHLKSHASYVTDQSRQSSVTSSASEDLAPKYHKENTSLHPSRPTSSRTYTSSRASSIHQETVPLSTCRNHSISG